MDVGQILALVVVVVIANCSFMEAAPDGEERGEQEEEFG
jgi:hypothetical protein